MKNMQFNKVCVIGLGYIGLPTAATFAAHGIEVIGVDVNRHAVNLINQGKIHIVEPELDLLVKDVVSKGKLKAQINPTTADAFIIAVPTPFKDNHEPDLSYIKAASKSLAPFLKPGNLVILESTSPVGATEQVVKWLSESRPDLIFPKNGDDEAEIMVAYCPERVLPGKILEELISNDRIVGGISTRCASAACSLYKLFVKGECITTNARTAEMCKLTENSFRDVNIAFANELSIICDKLNVNVWELIKLANRHPRVNILQPGSGVGGHCIAVDPWFIINKSPHESKIIHTARKVNDYKTDWIITKVQKKINNFLEDSLDKKMKDVVIVCYGLTFKPNIDDLRESPALKIVRKLAEIYQGKVVAIEPNIKKLLGEKFKLVNLEEVNNEKKINLLLVKHKEFLNIKFSYKNTIDIVGLLNEKI